MGNILGAPLQEQPAAAEELRARAREEARLRGEAFERSKACYARGDHAGAKKWSEEGKRHARRMEDLNSRAAAAVFEANNAARPLDEVDLHGLHVREAVARADAEIEAARARGASRLVFIVGRGVHSADGVARIKPALTGELMRKHSLRVTAGVPNDGCLLVELGAERTRVGWFERLLGCIAAQVTGGGGGGGRGPGGGGQQGGCVIS